MSYLKQLKSGLSKFFTWNRVVIILVFLVLAYVLMSYSYSKQWSRQDLMTNQNVASSASPATPPVGGGPSEAQLNPNAQIQSGAAPDVSGAYFPKPTITNPQDLLPRDANSEWTTSAPSGIQTPDLLQAGALIGLDTIGQTLRNPNLQLRSDPVIPKVDVGPFNNSTIEPDLMRAPFEINAAGR